MVFGIEPRSNVTVSEILFADGYINEENMPSNITIEGKKWLIKLIMKPVNDDNNNGGDGKQYFKNSFYLL